MKKIVQLNIADEYIEGAGVSIGAAGSHDETEIECHFSELWENTTKTVCWINSMGESVTVTVTPLMDVDGNGNTYRVPIPAEAKKYSGEAGLTIKGCLIDDETAKEIIAVVTGTAYFLVPEAIWGEGETEDVTPSQAEQLQAEIDEIKETIGDAQKSAAAAAESHQRASACADIAANCMNNAAASADNALKSEAYVVQQARNSESWAVGGTGTRENEDINNAKYWSEQAQNAAGGGVTSFNGRQGVVMPDKNDYTPDFIGAMAKSVYDADNDSVVDDAKKLNGQPASYYATKAEVQTAQTTADNAWSLAGGKVVASNTDLNTVTSVGNYYCPKTADANTMPNVPRKVAFTLKVESATGSAGENSQIMYRRQIWQGFNTEAGTYERTGETADGGSTWSWGGWKQHLTSGNSKDLLWTNASPTSEFASQKVNCDWSQAETITIEAVGSALSGHRVSTIEVTPALNRTGSLSYVYYDSEAVVRGRDFIFVEGGIQFYNGVNNGAINNLVLVPVNIYSKK